MLKEKILRAAGLLLEKNIPFCLYRFPGQADLMLAVDADCLPHNEVMSFLFLPFSDRSGAAEIYMQVVSNDFINEDFIRQVASLPARTEINAFLPDETSRESYFKRIQIFLDALRAGMVEKAVLSRVLYVDKPEDFNPLDCFLRLEHDYPRTLTYLLLHPESGMWMGATPELLLQKDGSEITTMSLAGTQAKKPEGDYKWRAKEIEEHEMVDRHIEEVFKNHSYEIVRKNGPHTVETAQVAHLKTDYLFREQSTVSLKELIRALHPTPAVGGLPVEEAVQFVLDNEGYDRKYYSGVIGQTNFSDKADLYVNLRCMQVGAQKIAIFVGGGITADSDPQEEWEETVLKSKTMIEKINPMKELYHNEIIR